MGPEMKTTCKAILLALLLSLMTAGCVSFAIDRPADFSEYERTSDWYRAIAADGVRIRVRLIENRSKGSANMWRTATVRHLEKSGYQKVSEKNFITVAGEKASHSEFTHHYFGREFIYTVTLLVKKDHIGVVETAGEKKYYEAHREALLKAAQSFRFK